MNPLSRKLIFGDREQINAVNALINQNQKEAEEEEKLLSGELTWFDVEVNHALAVQHPTALK